MSVGVIRPVGRARPIVSVETFSLLAALCDGAIIAFSGIGCAVAYHLIAYGEAGNVEEYFRLTLLVAFVYFTLRAANGSYEARDASAQRQAILRMLHAWNVACIIALVAVFAAKETADFSRGALALSYVAGLGGLISVQSAFYLILRRCNREGWLARRLLVVGTKDKLAEIENRLDDVECFVCERVEISDDAAERNSDSEKALDAILERAVESARSQSVDAILLLIPWSRAHLIERCAEAFMTVPATLHLGPERILERFSDVCVSREGGLPTLSLAHAPLERIEILVKRLFDIAVVSLALLLLAPFLALVAFAIKLDSRGPVFFRQRRHGFNQNTFAIIKFRTMSSQDDGDVIKQATADDERVTRVGRWLRRTSIDELPQLINVLRGDMSIVGPRPHALTHNREYQEKIALYARRHNVKPGITGWAQINGLRGRTETVEQMSRRVDHDLYYIDHWSLSFDIFIIICTLLSPSAFRNAY